MKSIIIKNLIAKDIKNLSDLDYFKRKTCANFKIPMLKNAELLEKYKLMVEKKQIKPNLKLEELLKKRKIRTMSGVAPIAVLTKPYKCPGNCLFCPTEKKMPKSYLSNEPAVMRAILTKFDPIKQVKTRLDALNKNGHETDKIELIVMGGTWSYLPKKYQEEFIKKCFDTCNGKKAKSLAEAQKLNETAKHRIVALTLETRPDYINEKEIVQMRRLGCTKVEMGVQAIDDYILQLNQRNHKVANIIKATKLLKNAGFKVCYHLMPNLYGSSLKKDFKMFKQLFTDQNFQPDFIKIYPCVVTKNSQLYDLYQNKQFKPYSDKQLIDLLIKIKKITPEYVRISRLIRDIPEVSIEAGNKVSNLRQVVQKEMRDNDLFCKCIRCREARTKIEETGKAKLFIKKYKASSGQEYFLQYASPDKKTLYAFLRLRFPGNKKSFIPELSNCAIIREVHTYGKAMPILSNKILNTKSVQHIGFGKKLTLKAEQISKKQGYKKIAVISGVGVREYYRKMGYLLEGTYMVKYLTKFNS